MQMICIKQFRSEDSKWASNYGDFEIQTLKIVEVIPRETNSIGTVYTLPWPNAEHGRTRFLIPEDELKKHFKEVK